MSYYYSNNTGRKHVWHDVASNSKGIHPMNRRDGIKLDEDWVVYLQSEGGEHKYVRTFKTHILVLVGVPVDQTV